MVTTFRWCLIWMWEGIMWEKWALFWWLLFDAVGLDLLVGSWGCLSEVENSWEGNRQRTEYRSSFHVMNFHVFLLPWLLPLKTCYVAPFACGYRSRVSDWSAGFANAATGKFSWEVPSSLQVALAQGPGLSMGEGYNMIQLVILFIYYFVYLCCNSYIF